MQRFETSKKCYFENMWLCISGFFSEKNAILIGWIKLKGAINHTNNIDKRCN